MLNISLLSLSETSLQPRKNCIPFAPRMSGCSPRVKLKCEKCFLTQGGTFWNHSRSALSSPSSPLFQRLHQFLANRSGYARKMRSPSSWLLWTKNSGDKLDCQIDHLRKKRTVCRWRHICKNKRDKNCLVLCADTLSPSAKPNQRWRWSQNHLYPHACGRDIHTWHCPVSFLRWRPVRPRGTVHSA